MTYDVVVIGAGAAGCFSAIIAAETFPGAKIAILEKSQKPLAKVRISGGGRCNVTNVISEPAELAKHYPRGERFLKKAFYAFSSRDMVDWLAAKGIPLRLYSDGCYFPESNSSQTIIDCFLTALQRSDVKIQTGEKVEKIARSGNGWHIHTGSQVLSAKNVIVTSGGMPKLSGFDFLSDIGVEIVPPVPSLFTFNLPDHPVSKLMGIVSEASVKLAGEKQQYSGPLLITHWGMSGPAILKASAFGARKLADSGYQSDFLVNWSDENSLQQIAEAIEKMRVSAKKVLNDCPFPLKSRLWEYLCLRTGVEQDERWNAIGQKKLNKLIEVVGADLYHMSGKTTFKEEFVTAGGVALSQVDPQTMQHKKHDGLFFAGEALDIDGVTGGFNFQSAWTTGYIAGKSVLLGKG